MTPKHFLDLSDLTSQTVRDIVDEARRRKEARAGLPNGTPDADHAHRKVPLIVLKK